MKKYKVIKLCIDQDSKKTLEPGDVVNGLSDFERGRHLAENNIVPLNHAGVEHAVSAAPENRRAKKRRRVKDNVADR